MSDFSTGGAFGAGGLSSNAPSPSFAQEQQYSTFDVANRAKIILGLNPYMEQNANAVMAMANMNLSPDQLVHQSAAMYGMMAASKLKTQLQNMTVEHARGVYDSLTRAQQMTLQNQGFSLPNESDNTSWTDNLGFVGDLIDSTTHVVGSVVKPVIGETLDALKYIADVPGHFYRTIRTMDDGAQWAGLAGAVIGIGAVLAAVPTGGASLAALGAVGWGAVAGATAAELVTSPGAWYDAWNASAEGEHTFKREARAQADRILGDPRLVSLAHDVAVAMPSGFSLSSLAQEMAGEQNLDDQRLTKVVEQIATRLAPIGSPGFQRVYDGVLKLTQQPLFQDAVTKLQQGKISFGRDFASGVLQLDQSSTLYHVVSGGMDATWMLAMDPTMLALGTGRELYQAGRYGIDMADGASAASRFATLSQNSAPIRRVHESIVQAVNNESITQMRHLAPQSSEMWLDLLERKHQLQQAGQAFTREEFVKYVVGRDQLASVMRGIGTTRGKGGQIVLKSQSLMNSKIKDVGGALRSFTHGMADPRLEARYLEEMAGRNLNDLVPNQIIPNAQASMTTNMPWMHNELHPTAMRAGRTLGNAPVVGSGFGRLGNLINEMTTMIPPGKAINLVGPQAGKEVKAMTELGRYMGMPSWARSMWADAILTEGNVGMRMNASMAFLDGAMTTAGVRSMPEGEKMIQEFLERYKHAYAGDGLDLIQVGGNKVRSTLLLDETATHIMMPDLKELRKAAKFNYLGKYVMGVTDSNVIDGFMTRIWKPGVLLRIGFIPRAAGEEYLSYLLRGGLGKVVQEMGARNLGHLREYEAVSLKLSQSGYNIKVLTEAEQALLRAGSLPAHVRPLARMVSRLPGNNPVMGHLQNYSRWLSTARAGGQKVGALESGLGWEDALNGFFDRLGGSALNASRMHTGVVERARLNATDYAKSIIMGNETNWRHLITGGVNDDLIKAGRAWSRANSRIIMGEVSAGYHGPVDPGFAQNERTIETVVMPDGKTRQMEYVTLRHEHTRVHAFDDGGWQKGQVELIARPGDDELFRETLLQGELWKVLPPSIGHQEAAQFARNFVADSQGVLYAPEIKILAAEFTGSHSRESLDVALDTIGKWDRSLAEELAGHLPSGRVTTQDLENAFHYVGQMHAPWQDLANQWNDVSPALQHIEDLVRQGKFDDAGFLSQLSRRVSHDPGSVDLAEMQAGNVLYDNPNDAFAAMEERVYGAALSPHYQNRLGGAQRLGSDGQTLRDGQVTLWVTPGFKRATTMQELLAHTTQPEVLLQHEDVVQALLADYQGSLGIAGSYNGSQMVADRRLADALGEAQINLYYGGANNAPMAPVQAVDVDRAFVTGRYDTDTGIRKLVKNTDGRVAAWKTDDQALISNRLRSVDPNLDTAAREYAQALSGRARQIYFKERRVGYMGRRRPDVINATGTTPGEIMVFRQNPATKELTPLGSQEVIPVNTTEKFFDADGRPIKLGDTPFFNEETLSQTPEVMWSVVGPHMEDVWDRVYGVNRAYQLNPIDLNALGASGIGRSDLGLAYRFRTEHLSRAGADLADSVTRSTRALKREGTLDRITRFGFDKVIGPSIDAIARRPMAFHFFADRYIQNMRLQSWLIDSALEAKVADTLVRFNNASPVQVRDAKQVAEHARQIAAFDGDATALNWNDGQALAWIRGHDDLAAVVARSQRRLATKMARNGATPADKMLEVRINAMGRRDLTLLQQSIPVDSEPMAFLEYIRNQIGEGALRSDQVFNSVGVQDIIQNNPRLAALGKNEWDVLKAYHVNVTHVEEAAGQYAAEAAVNDMMPFIDSHELRTQFADHYKGFMPFWYAEENFLKRWARTVMLDPSSIRKAQIGFMGLKSAGIVQSDGKKDYFVYPGSGLLNDVLQTVFPSIDASVMFRSPVEQMVPGLGNQFGAPSFAPIVTMPMNLAKQLMPDLEPVYKSMVGEENAGREWYDQIIPTTFKRLWDVTTADETDKRFASAMMSAIAMAEAQGRGIKDNASDEDIDNFLRDARNSARIILLSQALGGFFTPGAPQAMSVTEDSLSGLGINDPRRELSADYVNLVTNLGIELGTATYLQLHPQGELSDIVNPIAFTQSTTEVAGKAPLPATQIAVDFYNKHSEWYNSFPDAGAWLLPLDLKNQNSRSQYAYDQQTIQGLRRQLAPEEFLRSMKFKEAAGKYFRTRESYLTAVDIARGNKDDGLVRKLNDVWTEYSSFYKAAHPVFATELEEGKSRKRRADVIEQLRIAVNDPQAPKVEHFDLIKKTLDQFDMYKTTKSILSEDGSAKGRTKVEALKAMWEKWMTGMAGDYPELAPFMDTIIRPSSDL